MRKYELQLYCGLKVFNKVRTFKAEKHFVQQSLLRSLTICKFKLAYNFVVVKVF